MTVTAKVAETATVYPGTVLGEGCRILDYAVVGKQPTLGPRSTAKQEDLLPLFAPQRAGRTFSTLRGSMTVRLARSVQAG